MAMGTEVVPALNRLMNATKPGNSVPAATPERHGDEDPQRQVAVEEGELLGAPPPSRSSAIISWGSWGGTARDSFEYRRWAMDDMCERSRSEAAPTSALRRRSVRGSTQ
jgi:hypothetical protein